ncbi:MAG: tetratricopeptide repeat protein [Acidobacteriota bacterium]
MLDLLLSPASAGDTLRVAETLGQILKERPVLLLGISPDDLFLIQGLKGLSPGRRFTSRAIVLDDEWSRLDRKHLDLFESVGLQPIQVPDLGSLEGLLREVALRLTGDRPPVEAAGPVQAPSSDALVFEIEPRETWTVSGPSPGTPPHRVASPLLDREFIDRLKALQKATGKLIPQGVADEAWQRETELLDRLAQEIGRHLAAVLLSETARAAVLRRINQVDLGCPQLVIRVRDVTPHGDQALALPWELLTFDARRFPVRDGRLDLVREAVAEGAPILGPPAKQLTLAVAIAAPADQTALRCEDEEYRLYAALSRLGHRVAFAELGGLRDFVKVITEQQAQVVHFSGHGLPGELVFENELGAAQAVAIEDLVRSIHVERTARSFPRLFFLASCHGATDPRIPGWETPGEARVAGAGGDLRGDLNAVLGRGPSAAATLHRSGFVQVVGYFGPIGDTLCTRAEEAFYGALAQGETTLRATARARARLDEPLEENGQQWINPLGWSQLAVYHRGPDLPLAQPAVAQDHESLRHFRRQTLEINGLPVLKFGFVGRRSLQHKVRGKVRAGQRLIVLQGLGGLGKTAFAIHLLSKVFAHQPGDRLILRCQELENHPGDPIEALRGQAEEHGALYGFPGWDWHMRRLREKHPRPAAGFAAVVRQLRQERPDLVIYADNVEALQSGPRSEDPDQVLGAWRPEARAWWQELEKLSLDGIVLISTRFLWPELSENAWVPIEPMSPAEVLRMIDSFEGLERLPRDDRLRLADMVDGHPRTVELLDRLIEEQRKQRGLQPEAAHWAELIEPVLPRRDAKISADLLLELLWDRLSKAAQLLAMLISRFLAPAPRRVIDELSDPSFTDELIRAGLLTLYSEHAAAGETGEWRQRWGLHSLVRAFVVRQSQAPPWEPQEAERWIGKAYQKYVEVNRGAHEMERQTIAHLLAAGDGESAWPLVVAQVDRMREEGRYREASEMLTHCRTAGLQGDRLAMSLTWLAEMRRLQGETGESVNDLLKSASSEPVSDEVRYQVLHEQARLLKAQGQSSKAERLLRESLSLTRESLGTDHQAYTTSLQELAEVFLDQDKVTTADVLLAEANQSQIRDLGTGHLARCNTLRLMAKVSEREGRLGEAATFLREAAELLRKIYPYEHPAFIRVLRDLGEILILERHFEEAGRELRQALSAAREAQGRSGPDVASILALLAEAHLMTGSPEAGLLASDAFAALDVAYSKDHPEYRKASKFVAWCRNGDRISCLIERAEETRRRGLLKHALRSLEHALDILHEDDPEGDPRSIRRRLGLILDISRLYWQTGRYKEASESMQEALRVRKLLPRSDEVPGWPLRLGQFLYGLSRVPPLPGILRGLRRLRNAVRRAGKGLWRAFVERS